MGFAPLLSRFCLVRQSRILLECPLLVAEVLLSPGKYHNFQNFTLVIFFVDFDRFVYDNQGCLAGSANSTPDHDGLQIFAVLDDRPRSLSGPASAVSTIVCLFHCEQLLICEDDPFPAGTCGAVEEYMASLQQHKSVIIGEELSFLELVGLEV
jgi:hypothetical protein